MLQWIALLVIPLLSATTYRFILWETDPTPFIFTEFRGIVLFLPDYGVICLIGLTLVRLRIDPVFAAQWFDTGRRIVFQDGGRWWLALVAWMGLSILWAASPTLAYYATLHVLAGLLLALTAAVFTHQGHALLWGIGLGAAAQGLIGIAQAVHHATLGLSALGELQVVAHEPFLRAYGLSVNPNNLAGYLLVGLFASALLTVETMRRNDQRLLLIILLPMNALIAGGLLVTLSRSAFIGLVGAALSGLLIQQRRARVVGIAALLIIGVLVGFLMITGDSSRLSLQRAFYFEDTFAVLQRAPFLGVGAGSLLIAIHQMQPVLDQIKLPVHDVYVLMLAELGLPGLIFFGLAWGALLAQWRQAMDRRSLIWGSGLAALCIVMLFDFYPWDDYRMRTVLFWVIGVWYGLRAASEASPAAASN